MTISPTSPSYVQELHTHWVIQTLVSNWHALFIKRAVGKYKSAHFHSHHCGHSFLSLYLAAYRDDKTQLLNKPHNKGLGSVSYIMSLFHYIVRALSLWFTAEEEINLHNGFLKHIQHWAIISGWRFTLWSHNMTRWDPAHLIPLLLVHEDECSRIKSNYNEQRLTKMNRQETKRREASVVWWQCILSGWCTAPHHP